MPFMGTRANATAPSFGTAQTKRRAPPEIEGKHRLARMQRRLHLGERGRPGAYQRCVGWEPLVDRANGSLASCAEVRDRRRSGAHVLVSPRVRRQRE